MNGLQTRAARLGDFRIKRCRHTYTRMDGRTHERRQFQTLSIKYTVTIGPENRRGARSVQQY